LEGDDVGEDDADDEDDVDGRRALTDRSSVLGDSGGLDGGGATGRGGMRGGWWKPLCIIWKEPRRNAGWMNAGGSDARRNGAWRPACVGIGKTGRRVPGVASWIGGGGGAGGEVRFSLDASPDDPPPMRRSMEKVSEGLHVDMVSQSGEVKKRP
jgi:hypothetical protein